eukprot:TRINITY_DN1306_c3_g2_i1.p1 TRINITY_DN1306_c3_g2~~TRINITY_DN1306_c3_g2_i1.p1  ORF type:complete len:285 (+),score=121.84 TRINITY_DN1306_c3_g2_i1:51-905(+)
MRSATLLLLASVLLASVCPAAADGKKGGRRRRAAESQVEEDEQEASHSFSVSYSADGKDWTPKGEIVVGKNLKIWVDKAFSHWDDATVQTLVGKKQYYLRVSQAPVGEKESGFVQLAISTCELINAAFAEFISVTFAPHDDEKRRVIGLAPFGSAYTNQRASHLDACSAPETFDSRLATLLADKPKLAHQFTVNYMPPKLQATFGPDSNDLTIYSHTPEEQARRAQEEARRRAAAVENGEEPAEKREQTFWEKYWLYILMAFLFMKMQGAAEPQQGGGGGGGGK